MSAFDASEKEVFSGLRDGVADLADAMQGIRQAVDTTMEREEEERQERRRGTDEEYERAWEQLADTLNRRGMSGAVVAELRAHLEDRDEEKHGGYLVNAMHLHTIAKRLWADW